MKYLVDTDWVVDYLYGNPQAQHLIAALEPDGLAISIITYLEIHEGIQLSRDPVDADRAFRAFLRRVQLLPLSRTVAKSVAAIRAVLRKNKAAMSHRALDLIIAGTALAYDLELLTRNTKDYTDVPNLRLYKL
jgi:predicted nucleic acid-binding protein